MSNDWFKQEKTKFFKGVPKKDGSGGGLRLNKGRGGCPPEKQKKIGKGNYEDFTPKRALKLAGGMTLVGVGTAVAVDLLGDLTD